jgi:hypothetical protein
VRLLALPTNKGLPLTNTIAYYEQLQITDVKDFISLDPGIINAFTERMPNAIPANMSLGWK